MFLARFLIPINLRWPSSWIAAYQKVERWTERCLNIPTLMRVAREPYLFHLLVLPTVPSPLS